VPRERAKTGGWEKERKMEIGDWKMRLEDGDWKTQVKSGMMGVLVG
jgi:hypothetical protein